MPEQTARHALIAILREIDAASPALAVATPPQQRLTMTAWIARARAMSRDDDDVRQVARTLQDLGQTWWPGSIAALSRTTMPSRVFPDARPLLRNWDAVAREAAARIEHIPGWADDDAREPRTHAPAAMFAAICDVLTELGGPLGAPARMASAAIHSASSRLHELERIAAELRWLRGCIAAEPWAAAIGRVRYLSTILRHCGN